MVVDGLGKPQLKQIKRVLYWEDLINHSKYNHLIYTVKVCTISANEKKLDIWKWSHKLYTSLYPIYKGYNITNP